MKPIVFFIFLLAGLHAFAQEKIDTDRPDQTESAVLVPKKYFQAEFGFGKENLEGKNYTLAHPAFLLKYGLSKRFELRLESEYTSEYIHLIPETKTTTDLQPIEIGTKIALFEEKDLRPKTSLIIHVGSSFKGSNPFEWPYHISYRITCQHSITEKIGLGYNLGQQSDEEGWAWLYTFSPNISIGKRWYGYVEAFGFKGSGMSVNRKWQHAFDAGFAYYISNDAKVDLSGGIGLADNPMRNYIALGFSFRIPVKEKYRLDTH